MHAYRIQHANAALMSFFNHSTVAHILFTPILRSFLIDKYEFVGVWDSFVRTNGSDIFFHRWYVLVFCLPDSAAVS